MSLTSTIYVFEIDLADADRGVYESLSLRIARHPSENEDYLVMRVLAYCLEYEEGIRFSAGGLSDPDEPALAVYDLTGRMRAWIEVGLPDAARLHKASKAAPRVAVYAHRDPRQMLKQLEGERIHRANEIAVYSVTPALRSGLVSLLQRRMSFSLSVTDGHFYLSSGDHVLEGERTRHMVIE